MTILPPWPDRLTPDFVADYVYLIRDYRSEWTNEEERYMFLQRIIKSIAKGECDCPQKCCEEAIKFWGSE